MPTIEAEIRRPDNILSKAQVAAWLGVSQSTVDRWSRDGQFPPRLRLGPGRIGWSQSRVQAWIDDRAAPLDADS